MKTESVRYRDDDENVRAHHEEGNAAAAAITARELAKLLRFDFAGDTWSERITFPLRRIREGETIFRSGDRFHSVYVVRFGFFKNVLVDPTGSEQVLGFPMTGDIMGIDGIDRDVYVSDGIALAPGEVAIVPFARLTRLGRECPRLEQTLYRILSRELVGKHGMLWLLGTLGAEARVAAFLLHMSERFGSLGYSRTAFILRMTRQDIGSFLGLKLETVSRTLSAFDAAGIINVKQKSIEILSAAALNRMLERPVGLSAKAGNRGKSQDQGDSASPDAKRNSNGANSIASFLQLAAV